MVRLEFQIGLQYEVYAPTHFMFHFAAARTPTQTVLAEPMVNRVRDLPSCDAANVAFCTAFGNVRLGMPAVSVRAVENPELGLQAPQRTHLRCP